MNGIRSDCRWILSEGRFQKVRAVRWRDIAGAPISARRSAGCKWKSAYRGIKGGVEVGGSRWVMNEEEWMTGVKRFRESAGKVAYDAESNQKVAYAQKPNNGPALSALDRS